MMQYFGRFTLYTPATLPEDMPPEMAARVLWLKNEDGIDLYELRKELPEGYRFVTIEDDNSIRVVHDDPHFVWPDNGRLYAVPVDFPMDPALLFGRKLNTTTGEIIQPAPPAKKWTPLEFMEEFTVAERVAMRNYAKTDDLAADWLDLLRASTQVLASDQRTIDGLNYMVTKNVLTQARVTEILTT